MSESVDPYKADFNPIHLVTEAILLSGVPYLSAIAHDPEGDDLVGYALQVGTDPTFETGVLWNVPADANQLFEPMCPVADGQRCWSIPYGGEPLAVDQTYYWRIRFFDRQANASPWSDQSPWSMPGADYFMMQVNSYEPPLTNSAPGIQDTNTPVLIGVPSDVQVECNNIPVPASVTATNNRGSLAVILTQSTNGTCSRRIIRIWSAENGCRQAVSATQTITVVDTTPPVLDGVPADTTATSCGELPAVPPVTALDNCDIQVQVVTNILFMPTCLPKIQRTWTAIDDCGNATVATQVITVASDATAPVVTPPPHTTIECGESEDPSHTGRATATDNCNPVLPVTFTDRVEAGSCVGQRTITRTWSATDPCGNSATETQTIIVQDTTPPVLNPLADITVECESETDTNHTGSATATDNSGKAPEISFSNSIAEGMQVIFRVWQAVDDCGNSVAATQTITVADHVPPTLIGVPASIDIHCGVALLPPTVTATDCGTSLSVLFNETADGLNPVIYTRIWSAMDNSGNMASATQIVSVTLCDSISGTTFYAGRQTGPMWVVANTNSEGLHKEQATTITSPGPYTITDVPLSRNYWVLAFCDSNGNGSNDLYEAQGVYANNPLNLINEMADINVTLTDPDTDADHLPDWWEIRHFSDLDEVATENPDGDSFDNLAEYLGDSDPNDPGSLPGPVAYYRFNEAAWNGVLGEVRDSSRQGNHGTAYGGVTPTQDLWGSYAQFDGQGDYIEVPNNTNIQMNGDLTISFWMKPTADEGWLIEKSERGEFGIFKGYGGTLDFLHGGSANGGTDWGKVFLRQGDGWWVNGRWVYVTVTRDAATRTLKAYGNGVCADTWNYPGGLSDPVVTTNTLRIGLGHKGDGAAVGLDDVEIADRVWSEEEIRAKVDPDGDGMVTPWEETNGLNPTLNDADADADGDGYSNYQEYVNETNPQDPNSPEIKNTYYVNDANQEGDIYCTAVGSDANDGLSPATPMTTVNALVEKYTLGAGDVLYVDTGVYSNQQIYLTAADGGSAVNGFMTIQGSTDYRAGGTVLDYPGATILDISGASYVRVRDMTMRRGSRGVYVWDSSGIEFERVMVVSNSEAGFFVQYRSSVTMRRCVAAWNKWGVGSWQADYVAWENGVLWENNNGLDQGHGESWLRNSVVRQTQGCVYNSTADMRGDYNLFDLSGSATVGGSSYPKLSDWQKAKGWERHSTVASADLASPAELDFHPKSTMGRYEPVTGNWVIDTVQSACIDLGDPAATWINEPDPNGGRLNVGNYGNTAEASKSRTDAWLRALTYNEGGTLSGTSNALYWVGGNFGATDTVRIEYSADLGANWTPIATGIPATNGVYVWDVSGLSPMSCYWRVVLSKSDANVWDQNDQQVNVE